MNNSTKITFLTLCTLSVSIPFHIIHAADATNGKMLYERLCSGCHSINSNRIGPRHDTVFGSTAGSVDGYNYSSALQSSKLQWNEQSLNLWLSNPEATIQGQKMFFRVSDAKSRTDIIAYLKKVSQKDY